MSKPRRLLGLDIAALYSGAAVVEAGVVDGVMQGKVLAEQHLRTERVAAGQPPSWESMCHVAAQALDLIQAWDVTHVIYEGYAKGGFGGRKNKDGESKSANTTGYEQAELVGVVKHKLYSCGIPLVFLQVPPTTMSSFYKTTRAGKTATQARMKELLDFESRQRYSKWRTDCADAAAHAYLGAHVFAVLDGWEPEGIEESMRRVLLGDTRKSSGMIGLIHRPQLYIPRTACLPGGDDESASQED